MSDHPYGYEDYVGRRKHPRDPDEQAQGGQGPAGPVSLAGLFALWGSIAFILSAVLVIAQLNRGFADPALVAFGVFAAAAAWAFIIAGLTGLAVRSGPADELRNAGSEQPAG